MFSSHTNVNILTSLLAAHGIRHAVVCPGSRNAPIVHNLNECSSIACHPVTDERSAGFYALGMAQATDSAVAVCVTSGTALLNLAPAVAEAYYQQRRIIVVSADRPQAWIDQLDGQTLPQHDALGRFVRKAVTLPEPHDDVERWHCNRLVNEALTTPDGPVHINVPISEPLFTFSCQQLPHERLIVRKSAQLPAQYEQEIVERFFSARRPLLICGQPLNPHLDEVAAKAMGHADLLPDFILYTGESIVSKRLKQFLRKAVDAETWAVNADGAITDTFFSLTRVYQGQAQDVVMAIRKRQEQAPHPFVQRWQQLADQAEHHSQQFVPPFSQMSVVKAFEQWRASASRHQAVAVHYANSMPIRLANIYAHAPVWCNRGVNGIEGSLSTACGFASATSAVVCCIIGDLSFFYDQNALWNQQLPRNLRILLLNNGGGAIFSQLPGLEQSPARHRLVAACHHTHARGICEQNGVDYAHADSPTSVEQGLHWLCGDSSDDCHAARLLEVFTDAETDMKAFAHYVDSFQID